MILLSSKFFKSDQKHQRYEELWEEKNRGKNGNEKETEIENVKGKRKDIKRRREIIWGETENFA